MIYILSTVYMWHVENNEKVKINVQYKFTNTIIVTNNYLMV